MQCRNMNNVFSILIYVFGVTRHVSDTRVTGDSIFGTVSIMSDTSGIDYVLYKNGFI